jgi:hypothetical protein
MPQRQPKKIDPVPIFLADGKERHLYYTFEAAEVIEKANQDNLPKTRQMIVMLHAGLVHDEPDLTLEKVRSLCEMANAEYYNECIQEALNLQQANPTPAPEADAIPSAPVNGQARLTGTN